MTRQRAPIRAAVLALTLAGAFHTLPAQAVGLSQLYDEALASDAQLQSARAALAANSEELPLARARLLRKFRHRSLAAARTPILAGGFPASSGHSNGYVISLTQPLIHVDSWYGYAQGQLFSARRDLAKARYDTLVNSLKLKASSASLTDQDVLQLGALLSPVDDGALTALPQPPTVPHPGVAAKGAAGKLGRRAVPGVGGRQ